MKMETGATPVLRAVTQPAFDCMDVCCRAGAVRRAILSWLSEEKSLDEVLTGAATLKERQLGSYFSVSMALMVLARDAGLSADRLATIPSPRAVRVICFSLVAAGLG